MEVLAQHMDNIRVPQQWDKIYKDECVLSFDTPESPTGLYISLTSFLSFGRDYVERYFSSTRYPVYLHIIRTKKEIIIENEEDGPEKKITKLAIGTPGGFMPDQKKYTYDEKYQIVVLPNFNTFPYPNNDLPEKVRNTVQAILEADSAFKRSELEALSVNWEGEEVEVSKHAANLLQLNNGKKIPPSGWKCEKCDLTTNLWLNLTDGSIMCGRKFYDGTGGNDHAMQHFKETGYPLAVKLGAITKDGKGDVFSYDEDDMVEDPNLVQHLTHWGINVTQMEKTEKSMLEMELDLNQKFGEWVALQEAASKLTPIYGPGYTGLTNLGSSCYLNSVMQMIFSIPDFVKRFVNKADEIFEQGIKNPSKDFNVQMAKLGVGLLSGKYSITPQSGTEDEGRQGIPPRMFKILIGHGHPDFSSSRQQDAQEFFLHFINVLERNSRRRENPADCFKFKVEERFQCGGSKKVKYTYRPDYLLPLPIPLDMAINKEEVEAYKAKKAEAEANKQKFDEDLVRPRIKLSSCLETFIRTEVVEQFYSTALNDKTTACKTTRLATFPNYLLIHLKKFTIQQDWSPIKLDVAIEMPDIMDLNTLRGTGLQPGEELLPEMAGSKPPPPPVYDQAILDQLTDMGFPVEACKRALFFTQNQDLEAATNWLMEHIADSDFADPFIPPGMDAKPGSNSFVANEESIDMLKNMGFTREQSIKALKATDNNLERAADWIFSHQAELDKMETEEENSQSEITYRDGSSRYKLVGFISHMGTSTMVGHYVCHLLKEGRWIIYNDEKVYLSENPPKELGYIYMYQRLDD